MHLCAPACVSETVEFAFLFAIIRPKISIYDVHLLFLHRFKKSAQTGVTADVKAKERLATLQRDSRPLLYRYHEVQCLTILVMNIICRSTGTYPRFTCRMCAYSCLDGFEFIQAYSPTREVTEDVFCVLQGFTNAVKRPMLVRDFL